MSTLYQAIERNHSFKGTALTFMRKKIKYAELVDFIDIYASKLYGAGIRKNQVVTLISPNIPETIYTFYALNKIGAIALIVHPLIPAKTLKAAMEQTGSRVAVLPDIRYTVYAEELKEYEVLLLSPQPDLPPVARLLFPLIYSSKLRKTRSVRYLEKLPLSPTRVSENTDDRKPSVYLRSGGTTGDSKTIVLNDYAINRIAFQCHRILEIEPRQLEHTKMLGVLPIFHGFGLAMGVHAPLVNRAVSALMISFDSKKIVTMIRRNELNYIIMIPYMARKLLAEPKFKGPRLKNLTHAFIGGDKTDLKIFEEFDQRLAVAGSSCILLEGYGLTETVTVNFVNLKSDRKVGSVGKPLDGVKVRIVNSKGKILPTEQYGEIELQSDMLMLGYLDDPESTGRSVIKDADGSFWLKTGDIGKLDSDGFLYFKQRQKEVFKIAGINVFPHDIEKVALTFAEVKDAAALFVEDGKHPYVALFIESETEETEKLEAKLRQKLAAELIKYSVPEQIVSLRNFPRTNVGKVDRTKLIEFISQ